MINIKQIQTDMANGVLLGRETLRELVEHAAATERRLAFMVDHGCSWDGYTLIYDNAEFEQQETTGQSVNEAIDAAMRQEGLT